MDVPVPGILFQQIFSIRAPIPVSNEKQFFTGSLKSFQYNVYIIFRLYPTQRKRVTDVLQSVFFFVLFFMIHKTVKRKISEVVHKGCHGVYGRFFRSTFCFASVLRLGNLPGFYRTGGTALKKQCRTFFGYRKLLDIIGRNRRKTFDFSQIR